ncbi:MAG: hypothetical protein OEQ39_12150 [Gammaproteobacteria bacterium]|nr:hypothetical protein [Gammaproteobacteria bacterium]MDH3466656.1 hypothetical protein [Gammaproteobacteria bacterium]
MFKELHRLSVLAAICGALSLPATASEVAPSSEKNYQIGVSTWLSEGRTQWNHDASAFDPLLGNPTSKLTYRSVESVILELSGRVELPQRFFIEAAYGAGDADDGTLIDDDYLSAVGASMFGVSSSGDHLFSRTHSEIDGDDIQYAEIKFGRAISRFSDEEKNFYIYGGLQQWKEEYVATGVTQTVCTIATLCGPQGFSGFAGQRVISNNVQWNSVYIGVDGNVKINDRVTLAGNFAFTPFASLDNRDDHHLRSDLAQSPSFSMDGTGAGFNLDLDAQIRFSKQLKFTAGVRYWKLRVKDENNGWRVHGVNGGTLDANLNEFDTRRTGIRLGLIFVPGGSDDD